MMHIVLLSGGSGSRLWPLSNEARSKQFIKVLRNEAGRPESMVQRTLRLLKNAVKGVDVTIATRESQQQEVMSQAYGDFALVIEPERRDTAPAIMLACSFLTSREGSSKDDTVVVMPIDTYASAEYYAKLCQLDEVVQSGEAEIVLLGVEPTYASEKYGYIVPELNEGIAYSVSQFVEKPNKILAKDLIARGALWNCGVFAFKLGYLQGITKKYVGSDSYQEVLANFSELPKISFDYEVVERARNVAVVPYSGAWKDLGTWNTLTEEMVEDVSGRVVGVETCVNTHVVNELGLPLVALGLKDAVVVATPDGILVSDKAQSSYMKPLVEKIAESRPMFEKRRWGSYRVLDSCVYSDGRKSLTKELVILPGKQLSYQKHQSRSEVWTIVAGNGYVVINGKEMAIEPGSVVRISPEDLHSIRADSELHVIEVQLGELLVEEDIVRFGEFWENGESDSESEEKE